MNMADREFVWEAAWVTSCINGCTSVAVVRTVCSEDFIFAGVQSCHTDCIFNCVCTGICKENFIECWAGEFDNSLCGLVACDVCMLRSDCCKHCGLILNCLHNFWMLVSDICED